MNNKSQEMNLDDIVDSILDNVPQTESMTVRLPSLGKIYGLENEFVTIRGMTFEDERALVKLKNKTQAVNLLISRCVEEDLDPRQLIPQDKIFIIIHIRALSVGTNYDISITCGNCEKVSNLGIDVLNTFNCDYPEAPIEGTVEVFLPTIKKTALVRRASSSDLESNQDALYNRLWQYVKAIDGREETAVIMAVVNKLPIKDVHTIIDALSCEDISLNTEFIFECSECGHEEVTNLSLSNDFFTMR